jgi:hypothetical protein
MPKKPDPKKPRFPGVGGDHYRDGCCRFLGHIKHNRRWYDVYKCNDAHAGAPLVASNKDDWQCFDSSVIPDMMDPLHFQAFVLWKQHYLRYRRKK